MPTRAPLRRLLNVHPLGIRLAFLAGGAMLTLSFAPLGGYPAAPVLLLPLLTACLYGSPRLVARYSFWFGAGLFLFGTYWTYISIHVFGQAPLWLALFLMLGLVVVMGIYFALTGWLMTALTQGKPERLILAAPAGWVAVEWFRGWFLTGFPWLSLGYGQIDSPLAGWLPIVGVYGVSFLVVLTASAFVAALAYTGQPRQLAIATVVLPWLAGFALQWLEWTEPAGEPLTATIVQGGIGQDQKWQREQFQPTLELYRNSILANRDSDLIVWPEVAIPAYTDEVEAYLDVLQDDLLNAQQTLALGILEREGKRVYNSVLVLGGADRQVYRKRHLVPYGEYFPVPDAVREWMRLSSLPYQDMIRGDPVQPLPEMRGGIRLAVAICYEDAYGAEQLYALPEAGLLVNVSNDAWFGDSIAPHQHLEIARARALEAGRFVVRATNTGVSAFIGPDGELLQTAPQFRYATLSMDVMPMRGMTPYARTGNWPTVTLALLIVAWFAWRARR
jgi:apolipoprotein N-acyltransferase